MSDITYHGDSAGKKLARAALWLRQKKLLHARRGAAGAIVVLASRELGDVSALLALGFDQRSICAIDTDEEAIRICRDRYPNVVTMHDDVAAAAAHCSLRKNVVCAHLDFCGILSAKMVETVTRFVKRSCVEYTLLSVGMMRGRDRAFSKRAVASARPMLKRMKEDARAAARSGLLSGDYAAEVLECDGAGEEEFGSRSGGLWLEVDRNVQTSTDLGSCPTAIIRYHSSDRTKHGVPFEYSCVRMLRPSKRGRYDARTLGEALTFNVAPLPGDDIDMSLRRAALEWSKSLGVPSTAQLLNIDPQTIVAWRAHASRGTFAPPAAPRNPIVSERRWRMMFG